MGQAGPVRQARVYGCVLEVRLAPSPSLTRRRRGCERCPSRPEYLCRLVLNDGWKLVGVTDIARTRGRGQVGQGSVRVSGHRNEVSEALP